MKVVNSLSYPKCDSNGQICFLEEREGRDCQGFTVCIVSIENCSITYFYIHKITSIYMLGTLLRKNNSYFRYLTATLNQMKLFGYKMKQSQL